MSKPVKYKLLCIYICTATAVAVYTHMHGNNQTLYPISPNPEYDRKIHLGL